MKNYKLFLVSSIVITLLLGSIAIVSATPPAWPSSFYGEIHFVAGDGGPIAGDTIEAYVPGAATFVAQASIGTYGSDLVYSIKVPGDDPDTTTVVEGGTKDGLVTFMIGTRVVATGTWHTGTNVNLNIHPPKANAGGPYVTMVNETVSLSGSAEDLSTTDTFSYAWDLDNDAAYDDATVQNPTTTFSTAGIKTIGLKVIDSQGGEGFSTATVEVTKATAIVTLDPQSLSHTYDGNQKQAVATTEPSGLNVNFTYDSVSTPPTDAGSYAVVATIDDPAYQGTASGTLEISPAPADITLSDLNQDYDGDPKPITVMTDPADLSHTVTYDGSPDAPSGTGAYPVEVTITDSNYQGSETDTLVIRAAHSVTLVPGWNLVSFNLQPYPSTDPSDVLNSIAGSYDLVYAWDASGDHSDAGHWMSYDNVELTPDTLTEINEALGLWIHVTAAESQTLNVKGFMPNQTSIGLDNGAGGWNLVGFPASLPNTPESAFSGLENLSLVYKYDPTDSGDEWKIYDPDAPDYANDLDLMRPGFGYWILTEGVDVWTVDY